MVSTTHYRIIFMFFLFYLLMIYQHYLCGLLTGHPWSECSHIVSILFLLLILLLDFHRDNGNKFPFASCLTWWQNS